MLAAGPLEAQGNCAGSPLLAGGNGLGGGMRLSSQEPVNACVLLSVAMYMPMFDRVLVAVVTTLKSAMKSNVDPSVQFTSVWPFAGSLTLETSAILTSLAVQFTWLLWAVLVAARPAAKLYSFCKQVCGMVCADAGAASVSVPSKLKAKAVHQNRKSFVPLLILILFSSVFPDGRPWIVPGRPPGLTRRQSFPTNFPKL